MAWRTATTELACRCVRFIGNCLDSENTVVSHVARYAIFSGRACSPLGLNAQFCCGRYNKALNDLQNISKTSIWQHVRPSQSQSVTNTANVIEELLMVKSGYAVLPIWSNFEVEGALKSCVYCSFFIVPFLLFCVLLYELHYK